MELEAVAKAAPADPDPDHQGYRFTIRNCNQSASSPPCLDPTGMWVEILDDLDREMPVATMASRFHRGLAGGIHEMVRLTRNSGTAIQSVALSGGCFQNSLLLESVTSRLESDGFTCLTQAKFPANDGGLALGQAAIAAARGIAQPG